MWDKKSVFNIPRKVLVVDDEEINRRMLGHILENEYEVLYAKDGKEALDIIREKMMTLSAVLLDLLMPVMDGCELLDILNADPELKRIPVIVLTTEKDAEVLSLKKGAVDFIPKPYDMPEVIQARVKRTIDLYEGYHLINATQTDSLTGLFTRDYFFRYAQMRSRYYPDELMDAVAVNINRFHIVNEMYGRQRGRDLLVGIAERLAEYASSHNGVASRVGADLFYLYIPHTDTPYDIMDFVTDKIGEMFDNSRTSLRMGICTNDEFDDDIENVFDMALMACNHAKQSNHNQIRIYDSSLKEREKYDETLLSDMDKSLSRGEFTVFYQPKFDIRGKDSVLSGAEALVRWRHPVYGLVSPAGFVSLFEENGLMTKLDLFVWTQVAFQIKAWKDKYGVYIPVSVNVSRIDLLLPNFTDTIVRIVDERQIPHEYYNLEVTETVYADDSDQIIRIVEELKDLGFKVEMDDFGTGYSSLNMLSMLPVDAIKLDMAFIRNITSDEKSLKMVELMLDIAKLLSIPVIAEGVEEKEQFSLLKEAGCDLIQGYYFSKPVLPEEFEKFIEDYVKKCDI